MTDPYNPRRQWNPAYSQPQLQLEQEYDYQQPETNPQYGQYPDPLHFATQSIPNDYPFNPTLPPTTSAFSTEQSYGFDSAPSQNPSFSNNFLQGSSALQQQQRSYGNVSPNYDSSFVPNSARTRPPLSLSPPPLHSTSSMSVKTERNHDKQSSTRPSKGKRPRMNEPAEDFRDDEEADSAETKEKPIKPYVHSNYRCYCFLTSNRFKWCLCALQESQSSL